MPANNPNSVPREQVRHPNLRLIRVIVFESLLVAMAGLIVWGIAWDIGFAKVGLILAIVIWLTVSPVIEIATVMKFRSGMEDDQEGK